MNFLNPLHTPEMIARQIAQTNRFDVTRGTGRSTSLALRAISDAIANPFKPVRLEDHSDAPRSSDHLAAIVKDMILSLGLEHMKVEYRNGGQYLQFGA